MVVSWWEKGVWQIYMHHQTVHAKVEFPRFLPDVWGGPFPNFWSWTQKWIQFFPIGEVHSTTFDPELTNERFTLICFMGFPAILSTLQPFRICIFKRKYSKLTFSNGPQLMGERLMANLHAWLDSTWNSRISKISTRCQTQGVHSITFYLNSEMKDLHWYLLWGFLQYEVHYSYFKSAFSIENILN